MDAGEAYVAVRALHIACAALSIVAVALTRDATPWSWACEPEPARGNSPPFTGSHKHGPRFRPARK